MNARTPNLIGWLLPTGIVAGAVCGGWVLNHMLVDWHRVDPALHSGLETLGGLSAMALALVMLVRGTGETRSTSQLMLSLGFFGMGLVELSHAIAQPGHVFVWFRVLASLFGGLGFALSWWPDTWRPPVADRTVLMVGAGGAAVFSLASWALSDRVPDLLRDGQFTPLAIGLKSLSSALFMLGAVRFFWRYATTRRAEDYLFACLALLFAVAESVFSYSSLWDGPWWFWHFLRLLAYALVLGHIVRNYLQTVSKLRTALHETRTAETALRLSESQLRQSLDERERLGRNLHDSIIQSIYAIGLRLAECRRLIASDADQAVQSVGIAINEVNSVIREVRLYISGIDVEIMSGKELEAGMAALMHTMGGSEVMRFYLQVDPAAAERLTPLQATHLLYIAKEAMSNSLRHSHARNGGVSLKLGDGIVRMKVEDDGVGFDIGAGSLGGHGLKNIRARADLLGAATEFLSATGHGTQITIDISVGATDGLC